MMFLQKKICKRIFTAALFIIANVETIYMSCKRRVDKQIEAYALEYYIAIKRNEQLIHANNIFLKIYIDLKS